MAKVTVVSGCHPAGYDQYGKKFLETFAQHWPESIDLVFYTEEPVPMPRGECRSLWDIPGAKEFYEKHRDIPRSCGREQVKGWRDKDIERGYSYRYDAVKWFKQCIIPFDASVSLEDGAILVWLDADIVTFADVPESFPERMLGKDEVVSLTRQGQPTELGFYATKLNTLTRAFLRDFSEAITKENIFAMKEWHSGWAFDVVLGDFIGRGGKHGAVAKMGRGHVWFDSPLGDYMDHLKGNSRKKLGHSPESRIQWWR